ncbi:alpha-amylase family glycosyl hydrolase [Anaerosporobacter faecicola]|uniref:alpha-amylase family glycosyl hydrolase n=1 Tax=Anaerosporobacter faecicola TaxID=2718714 RepID=UPI00143BF60F
MAKWYDKAVFYHIYPLGLCGAEKNNDGITTTHRLKELEQWIPHMEELGCNALYIGPLFESVGHGYETTEYQKVDRRLGDNDDFVHFVQECHEHGIKVVVDGVFNHTGREFFAFRDLREKKEASPYKDWYCNVNFGGNTEYGDGFSYEGWRGYLLLAKLNQRNPEVKQYLLQVIQFWVDTFDIDGIRLDCADVLDFDFMKEMRSFCNTVKEDFWLMGEVIHGDYGRWVNEETLHSVTDYELHKGLYSGHNDHNYFEIAHTIKRLFDPNGGLVRNGNLYTFVDNHDVDRIYNKLQNKEHLYPVHILLYTVPGIPSIYYGSEFAIEGHKDNNSDDAVRPKLQLEDYVDATIEVGREERYRGNNPKLTCLLSKLAQIHKDRVSLQVGRYQELFLTNRQYAFARICEEEATIVAVNNDDQPSTITIAVTVSCDKVKNLLTNEEISVENGCFQATIPANYGGIYQCI